VRQYDPGAEGVDHVNAYSKSKLPIGQLLSNYAHTPFLCSDGGFSSMEGYWYWLGVREDHPRRDELRHVHGFRAKQLGRYLREGVRTPAHDFEGRVERGFVAKLRQHPEFIDPWWKYAHLPIVHYYLSIDGVITTPRSHGWLWDHMNTVRRQLFGLKT